MSSSIDYTFDKNLREVPSNLQALYAHVRTLKDSLVSTLDTKDRVSLLGELGVWLRILGELQEAESVLKEALLIINKNNFGEHKVIQHKIRLAHVYQYQKRFDISNDLYLEIISSLRTKNDNQSYLAFALQHAGKNQFDQGFFLNALSMFEEALKIRQTINAPKDQVESTQFALEVVRSRIES
jgi:tetratricopeptide (TPR) repeat protein